MICKLRLWLDELMEWRHMRSGRQKSGTGRLVHMVYGWTRTLWGVMSKVPSTTRIKKWTIPKETSFTWKLISGIRKGWNHIRFPCFWGIDFGTGEYEGFGWLLARFYQRWSNKCCTWRCWGVPRLLWWIYVCLFYVLGEGIRPQWFICIISALCLSSWGFDPIIKM